MRQVLAIDKLRFRGEHFDADTLGSDEIILDPLQDLPRPWHLPIVLPDPQVDDLAERCIRDRAHHQSSSEASTVSPTSYHSSSSAIRAAASATTGRALSSNSASSM